MEGWAPDWLGKLSPGLQTYSKALAGRRDPSSGDASACTSASKVVPSQCGTTSMSNTDTGTVLILPDGWDLCMLCLSGRSCPACSELLMM